MAPQLPCSLDGVAGDQELRAGVKLGALAQQQATVCWSAPGAPSQTSTQPEKTLRPLRPTKPLKS